MTKDYKIECTICKGRFESATGINIKKGLDIELCDQCRMIIFAELAKQFVIETWM